MAFCKPVPVTPQPRKLARDHSDLPDWTVGTPSKARKLTFAAEATAERTQLKVSPELEQQCKALDKLFQGLEHILVLFSTRGKRTALEGEAGVRKSVEVHTGLGFSDKRLCHILALAGEMLQLSWLGSGSSASLEIVQKAEEGGARAPSLEERKERSARFVAALEAAVSSGQLPSVDLPARPGSSKVQEAVLTRAGDVVDPEPVIKAAPPIPGSGNSPLLKAATPPGRKPSMEERIAALKKRILERSEAERSQAMHQAAIRDLESRCSACEDAMSMHGIMEHFFARAQGGDPVASEVEVLSAATSSCYAVQFRRPMDHQVAQAALSLLTSKSEGWYRTEAAQHSKATGSFFRRIAKGNSKQVMEVLQQELQELKAKTMFQEACGDLLETGSSATEAKRPTATPQRQRIRLRVV